ncbi:MAG TPA: very short patch repair endonuclease [bacterium]|nr:very short patch repair endonuclease [bacterium]
MADIVDKATRSQYMAAIKSRGNASTEKKMLSLLRNNRLNGWRRHYKIPGTPDFCWPRQKIALFVDGCFWHGCPHCYTPPKSNVAYWEDKIDINKRHDRKVTSKLRREGWSVIRVWECQLKYKRTIVRIERKLLQKGWVDKKRDASSLLEGGTTY